MKTAKALARASTIAGPRQGGEQMMLRMMMLSALVAVIATNTFRTPEECVRVCKRYHDSKERLEYCVKACGGMIQ